MSNIIEVQGLKKSYGDVCAVQGINFSVPKGSLFAFLGENGAGKSTTIDILCTILKQDGGTVVIDDGVLGRDDNKIRNVTGIVFQDSVLDRLLTVEENLLMRGGLYGLKGKHLHNAVSYALDVTDCTDFRKRKYGKLSGGQKRRGDIARALINTPKLLFLDEPTTGLDPKTRKLIWSTIENLRKNTGMTVFLTTHYMEEASLADFITIIGKGKILANGSPIQLKQEFAKDLLKIKPIDTQKMHKILNEQKIMYICEGEVFIIPLSNTKKGIEIAQNFQENIENIEIINGSMDDVFLNVLKTKIS